MIHIMIFLAIIIPIIVPMHESSEPTSLICTKINSTTTICTQPPPGPEDMISLYILFGAFIAFVIAVNIWLWKLI